MKINTLLVLGLLTLLTSCNGPATSKVDNTYNIIQQIAKGNTVKELGENIMLVYQDTKNIYWFGSWEDGLYRYDGITMLHFTMKDGLPSNRIDEIREDKYGNVYFNTSEGVSKFDGQHFAALNETKNSDSEWKLNPDDLWFKCSQYPGQVYRYDGKNLYRLQLPKTKLGEEYISRQTNVHNPYAVYCVYKDSKGNVWFGTATLGVCRYNGKSFDWISEEDVAELHNGPANGVRSVIEDKNGYFWFNTMYRYDVYGNNTQKQTFYNREIGIGSLDGRKDGDLHEYLSITKDNNNELWIATYTTGVWRYNGKDIIHYPVRDEGKDITLFSIYKDNNGDLWLGTHANGAFKFNGNTFQRFKL